MLLVNSLSLKEGDILLTRSDSRESRLIRAQSNSEYSHAILYVGAQSCIESDGLGVQSQNLQRLLFEKNDDLLVLRLKDDNQSMVEVVDFARLCIGTEYSTSEARAVKRNSTQSAEQPNRQFCTRFIAQAFSHAGIKIVNNPDYCSPQDLLESDKLEVLSDLMYEASEAEVRFAKSESPLEKQTEIHNEIFESARRIFNSDIQTFDQLNLELMKNPKMDQEISTVILNSGYLDMWKLDVEKNPWFYDYSSFKASIPFDQRKQVGEQLVEKEASIRKRFEQTILTLMRADLQYDLRYFKIQIDLYKKLIEVSNKREEIGNLALREYA